MATYLVMYQWYEFTATGIIKASSEEQAINTFGLYVNQLDSNYKLEKKYGYGGSISPFFYDEEEEINQYDLSLFVQEEDGRYRKYEETHLQRAYEQECVEELLKESGLELLHVYDAFAKEEPAEDAQRIYYVCRRPAR